MEAEENENHTGSENEDSTAYKFERNSNSEEKCTVDQRARLTTEAPRRRDRRDSTLGLVSNQKTEQSAICSEHSDESLIMFCLTCKSPVCMECMRVHHRWHEWLQLSKVAKEKRKMLSSYRREIDNNLLPKLQSLVKTATRDKEKVMEDRKLKVDMLKQQRDKLVAEVNSLSTMIISVCEGEIRGEEDLRKLENDIKDLQKIRRKLQTDAVDVSSDLEALKLEAKVSSTMRKINPHRIRFHDDIQVRPGYVDKGKLQDMLGRVTVQHSTVARPGKRPDSYRETDPSASVLTHEPCLHCSKLIIYGVSGKYVCGHKLCHRCWYIYMTNTRCPACGSV